MRAGGLIAAALLVAGCSTSSLLLLPDEDGGQGKVAVLDEETFETRGEIGQSNSRSRLSRNRASTRGVDPARLRRGERDVIGRIPPRPESFDLTFAMDSEMLEPAEQQKIERIAALVADRPGSEVEIIGHADTTGEASYNIALSRRRAAVVADALLARNVPADLISRFDFEGENSLAVPTSDNVAERANRRVEVTVR